MDLISFIKCTSAVFLAVLGVTVAYFLLIRKINLSGLLRDSRDGRLSPGRIQALLATIYGSASYLMILLADPVASALPPVSDEILYIVGGSHSLYLAGKLGSLLQRKFNFNSNT